MRRCIDAAQPDGNVKMRFLLSALTKFDGLLVKHRDGPRVKNVMPLVRDRDGGAGERLAGPRGSEGQVLVEGRVEARR